MSMPPSSLPARLWLRVDELEPLTCSVRFSLDRGEGYLEWNASPAGPAQVAVRTGTAGGLSARDLPSLALMVRSADGAAWVRHPLHPRLPADLTRVGIGHWEPVVEPSDPVAESTDLLFSVDLVASPSLPHTPDVAEVEDTAPVSAWVVEDHPSVHDGAPGLAADAETDTPGELEESITDFGLGGTPSRAAPGTSRPGASGSTLVRSLVKRIRIQDTELRALRKRVAELEAALRTGH